MNILKFKIEDLRAGITGRLMSAERFDQEFEYLLSVPRVDNQDDINNFDFNWLDLFFRENETDNEYGIGIGIGFGDRFRQTFIIDLNLNKVSTI